MQSLLILLTPERAYILPIILPSRGNSPKRRRNLLALSS